jgi:uncharacterized protein YbjT (DUF2867 family)
MMTANDRLVLVLGATGQQGGGVARALVAAGFRVRALLRDPSSPRAANLRGVELVRGDLRELASLDEALVGAWGVFSVQPSSGQPEYGVTDDDELRWGRAVTDAARRAGVSHLIYSSVAGAAGGTGVGHFESKWQIEEHVRASGVSATVVRPSAFMEILLQPHFGLGQGALTFFNAPDRKMQFIAAEDIGKLVARLFAEHERFRGQTIELAGDALTGDALAAHFARRLGRSVSYQPFPASLLEQNPLLRRLVELVNQDGGAAGNADLTVLRRLYPGLLTFERWLDESPAIAELAQSLRAARPDVGGDEIVGG